MRFLVFSDSHGSAYRMNQVLRAQKSRLAGVIHLGDGIEEFEGISALPEFEKLLFLSVCGNGEQYAMAPDLRPPLVRICEWEGIRVLLTHGHGQGVSFGTEQIARVARENGCTVALHGHTHIPAHLIDRGASGEEPPVEILCPGSIAAPRAGGPSYGVLELKGGQVLAYYQEV